ETSVTTENKNVAHVGEAFCGELQSDDFIKFVLKQEWSIGVTDLYFVIHERVFFDPVISNTNANNFFELLNDSHRSVVLHIPNGLQKEFITGNKLVIKIVQRHVNFSFVFQVCFQ